MIEFGDTFPLKHISCLAQAYDFVNYLMLMDSFLSIL